MKINGRLALFGLVILLALSVSAMQVFAAPPRDAKIDWGQCKGEQIVVALLLTNETDQLEPQIPEFEKLTGIKVRIQKYPELELHQKTLVDLASRSGIFDVVMTDLMFIPQYAKAGFVEPLNTYISNSKLTDKAWFDVDDFMPAVWDASQWNGKVWVLPLTRNFLSKQEYALWC
ncbi:MAG: extracellular solute-binding protein [Firmicutes bacterium]|nr:extracellular solute-binding protein [Bacillota bacterium]